MISGSKVKKTFGKNHKINDIFVWCDIINDLFKFIYFNINLINFVNKLILLNFE